MKSLKRVLALLMVGAMALSAAACGGDDSGTGAGEKKKNEETGLEEYILDSKAVLDTMPAELKNTKITFVNWYDSETHEEKEIIDMFEKDSGIDIVCREVPYSSYIDTVAGLLSVGETPDVMRLRDPEVGSIKLLQDIKTATGFDFSGKEWDEHIIRNWSFGEKCYGVNLVYTPYMMGNVLVYNTDTMKEMGYEDPWQLWKQGKWTWEKMKEMMVTWVEQGTDYIGSCIWPTHAAVVTRNGASFITRNSDGTYNLDLMNEEALEGWRFTLDGRAMNLFTNINDGVDMAKQTTLFGSMTASVVQGRTTDYFGKLRRKGVFAVVPLPKWEDIEYCLPMYEITAFGIPKAAKNPKAVPYFLSYLCNLDNYDLSIYDKETNPTGYFFDQQCKDVYLELLSIRNREEAYIGAFAQARIEMKSAFEWLLFMKIATPQLNSWLQTKQPILQNSVNVYNAEVVKFN